MIPLFHVPAEEMSEVFVRFVLFFATLYVYVHLLCNFLYLYHRHLIKNVIVSVLFILTKTSLVLVCEGFDHLAICYLV